MEYRQIDAKEEYLKRRKKEEESTRRGKRWETKAKDGRYHM
jgi:hypothetical protein